MMDGMVKLGTLRATETYGSLWFLRAALIPEMRLAGLEYLTVHRLSSASLVPHCFPDQSGWVFKIARHQGTPGFANVLKAAGYSGPPELFSAWMCVIGSSSAALAIPARTVSKSAERIRTIREAFVAEHGYEPHPLKAMAAAGLLMGD